MIGGIDPPSVYLEFSKDVDLAIRISGFGILPEALRQSVVEFAIGRATEGGDPRILIDASFACL